MPQSYENKSLVFSAVSSNPSPALPFTKREGSRNGCNSNGKREENFFRVFDFVANSPTAPLLKRDGSVLVTAKFKIDTDAKKASHY